MQLVEPAFKAALQGVEEQPGSFSAPHEPDPDPNEIEADGEILDLSNLEEARERFEELKTKAIEQGLYEGKSLKWLGGGRSRLLYDQLRVEGVEDGLAKRIVAENFQRKALQILSTGTESQKEGIHEFYESRGQRLPA